MKLQNKPYIKCFRNAKSTLQLFFDLKMKKSIVNHNWDNEDKNNILNILLFLKPVSFKKRLAIVRIFYREPSVKRIISLVYQIQYIRNMDLEKQSITPGMAQEYNLIAKKMLRKAKLYHNKIDEKRLNYSSINRKLNEYKDILLEVFFEGKTKESKIFSYIVKHSLSISSLLLLFLVISVGFYEWGYFSYLGIPLNNMPITLEIFLVSALSWIPNILIFSFISFIYFLTCFWVQDGMTINDFLENPRYAKLNFILYLKYYLLFCIVVVALFMQLPSNSDSKYFYYYSFLKWSFYWLLFTFLFFKNHIIRSLFPKTVRYMIVAVPVYIIFLLNYGYGSAQTALLAKSNTLIFLEDNRIILNTKILRNYLSGILIYRQNNKTVIFIRNQEIKKIEYEISSKGKA